MSLKYKLVTVKNDNYDESYTKLLTRVVGMTKGLTIIAPVEEPNSSSEQLINEVSYFVKQKRQELKEANSVQRLLNKLHLTSDRTWKMYNETIDDETGRTIYSKPELYKVDTQLDYVKNGNFKDTIKLIQANAVAPLKEYRAKSRELRKIEKEYNAKCLQDIPREFEVRPTFTVYASGGFGGAGSVVHKDAWRDYGNFTYEVKESQSNYNIHMEGGTFLELQKVTEIRRVFEPKKPQDNTNHVGVEIEFISKHDKFTLAKELVKEDVQQFVYLQNDGSLRNEDEYKYCHEINIVAPENIIELVLKRVLNAINKDKGSRVNNLCGLHVHLDMRNRDKELVYKNLYKAQTIMYAMNPRQRLDGTMADGRKAKAIYSKKSTFEEFHDMFQQIQQDIANRVNGNGRYYGINLLALQKHKTIEIRLHSGSTNFEKINNWVKILTSIANMTTVVEKEAKTAGTFCKYYKLDDTIKTYIQTRIDKFKDKDGKHVTVDEVA